MYSPEASDPGERLPEYLENKLVLRSLASLSLGRAHVLLHLWPRSMQQVWSVQEVWPPSLVITITSEPGGEQTILSSEINVHLSGEINKEIQQFYKAQNVSEVTTDKEKLFILKLYYRNLQA